MTEHQEDYPVTLMCRVLGVSSSGYIARRRPLSQRQRRIYHAVQAVYDEHQGIYGSWKIAKIIAQRDVLESACRNTVVKTMRQLGVQSKAAKGFKPVTTRSDPSKRPAMNLLDQDFIADGPNRKWLPTSRTCRRVVAGFTSQSSWTCLAVRSWAGRSVIHWRPSW